MNHFNFSNEFTSDFLSKTKEFVSRFTSKETFDDYLRNHAYFLTLQLNTERIEQRFEESAVPAESWRKENIALANFNRLYCQLCRTLIGRKYSKPEYLDVRPLAIVALDYDGTRTNAYTIVEKQSDLHLHAFLVVVPEHHEKMRAYFESVRFLLQHGDQLDGSVHVKRFENDLQSVLSYATKYLRFDSASQSSTFPYRIYPEDFYSESFEKPEPLKLRRRSRQREGLVRAARMEAVRIRSAF